MTVESEVTKVIAEGNGSATNFSFDPVVITRAADLVVVKSVTDSNGLIVETTLTEGTGSTNYSITPVGSYPCTGSVTYPATGGTPLATGEKIVMRRVLDFKQELDLENQGGFFAEDHEVAYDRAAMRDQQLQEQLARAVLIPVSSDADPNAYLATIEAAITNAETAAADAQEAVTEADAFASAATTAATEAAASAAAAAAAVASVQAVAANALWQNVIYLTHADSPYTIGTSGGIMYVVDSSGGACQLNLPSIAGLDLSNPWAIGIKKEDVSSNAVTVHRNGTDTIDEGTADLVFTSKGAGATLIPDTDLTPDDWTSALVGASTEDYIVDRFIGDGATVDFTLSRDPGTENNALVFINGVRQSVADYSVSGTTLTFGTAPPDDSGAYNIEVVVGSAVSVGTPGTGTVGATQMNAGDAAAIRALLGLGALAVKDTVATADIDNNAVTYAKMQAAAGAGVIGADAAGNHKLLTFGSGISVVGGALTSSGLGTSSVGQSQLKTSYNEASAFNSGSGATADFIAAGGEYSFAPVWRAVPADVDGVSVEFLPNPTTSFATYMRVTTINGGTVGTVRMRYISASPPYDWGDGPMASFIYAVMPNGASTPSAVWASEDPPWAYNGPTRTRGNFFADPKDPSKLYQSVFDAMAAGVENVVPVIARRKTTDTIHEARANKKLDRYLRELHEGELYHEPVTMEHKMRDMPVVPHPFLNARRDLATVVMLDPFSALTRRLTHLMRHSDEAGMMVGEFIKDHVKIGNVDLVASRRRKAPPGVWLVTPSLR